MPPELNSRGVRPNQLAKCRASWKCVTSPEVAATIAVAVSSPMPGTLNSSEPDPACGPQVRFDNGRDEALRFAMNNSFGFGGNNCSLVFGRA